MENKNGAALDPFEDGGLYDRYIEMVVQPVEIQGELLDPEWEQELDEYSKQYHPFQEILPDTRTGYDSEGNWHAVPHQPELPFDETNVYEAVGKALTPYRWASYLQDALQQYISNFEYTVGKSERWDIVQDIVSERMERCANMEERYNLEDALQIWYRSYGHGA